MHTFYNLKHASLNAMYLYCQTWKLQVNIFKTKVVIFSRSRLNTNDMNFKYNGESLNIVACSSAADSAKITVSSAYSNKYKRTYTTTSSVSRDVRQYSYQLDHYMQHK
jgi:hypothetical protein